MALRSAGPGRGEGAAGQGCCGAPGPVNNRGRWSAESAGARRHPRRHSWERVGRPEGGRWMGQGKGGAIPLGAPCAAPALQALAEGGGIPAAPRARRGEGEQRGLGLAQVGAAAFPFSLPPPFLAQSSFNKGYKQPSLPSPPKRSGHGTDWGKKKITNTHLFIKHPTLARVGASSAPQIVTLRCSGQLSLANAFRAFKVCERFRCL